MARWDEDEGRGRGFGSRREGGRGGRDEGAGGSGGDWSRYAGGSERDESWGRRERFGRGPARGEERNEGFGRNLGYSSDEGYGFGRDEGAGSIGGQRGYDESYGWRGRSDAGGWRARADEGWGREGAGRGRAFDEDWRGGRYEDEVAYGRGRPWQGGSGEGRYGWGDRGGGGDRSRMVGGNVVDRRNFGEMGAGRGTQDDRPRSGALDEGRVAYSGSFRGGSTMEQGMGYGERPYERGGWRGEERGGGDERSLTEKVKGFFGKGPKGYKRSDDRIREDVCDRLTEDPLVDASNIEIEVKDGEVKLSGTVGSRHEKRRAEDVVENILGVQDVHNAIRVRRAEERAEPQDGERGRAPRAGGAGAQPSTTKQ